MMRQIEPFCGWWTILKTLQPRVLSLEKVTDLVQQKDHTYAWFGLLGHITDRGCILVWRFANFAEHGQCPRSRTADNLRCKVKVPN